MQLPFFRNRFAWILIVIFIIIILLAIFFLTKDSEVEDLDQVSETDNLVVGETEKNLPGTIFVEAGEGLLESVRSDTYSYVGESARGLEAYLASGGTSATYEVEVATAGAYALWVKLSDDAMHESGTRSATVVVNDSQKLEYIHYSEDTKGWKWYELGDLDLQEGINVFVFTKNEETSAAYVMDEFKLVPLSKD